MKNESGHIGTAAGFAYERLKEMGLMPHRHEFGICFLYEDAKMWMLNLDSPVVRVICGECYTAEAEDYDTAVRMANAVNQQSALAKVTVSRREEDARVSADVVADIYLTSENAGSDLLATTLEQIIMARDHLAYRMYMASEGGDVCEREPALGSGFSLN